MTQKIHRMENVYFVLRILFSVLGLGLAALWLSSSFSADQKATAITLGTIITYVVLIAFYVFFTKIIMLGHLRGNGIEINARQFAAAAAMVQEICQAYGLKTIPKVFVLQSGGVLNAFAARFSGKEYVAIYSDIFCLAEADPEVLKFVLAHELAHVVRRHNQKRFWTLLSFYVPFLGPAYSRACEHTCDGLASGFVPANATKGLILLAAGKDLYQKVDTGVYLESFETNNTPAVRFAGLLASHPYLPKRIQYITTPSEVR